MRQCYFCEREAFGDSQFCAECIGEQNPLVSKAKYQNPTLNERESTHGDYGVTAQIAQDLKEIIRPHTQEMPAWMQESLDMICTKMARICSGNWMETDHLKDIEGYSALCRERLENPLEPY